MTRIVNAAEEESREWSQNQLTDNVERLDVNETVKWNSRRNGAIVLFHTEKEKRKQTLAAALLQVKRIGANGVKELQQFG